MQLSSKDLTYNFLSEKVKNNIIAFCDKEQDFDYYSCQIDSCYNCNQNHDNILTFSSKAYNWIIKQDEYSTLLYVDFIYYPTYYKEIISIPLSEFLVKK